MLMHGVYSDALCIHTPSRMDPTYPDACDEESIGNTSFLSSLSDVKENDPRKNLNDSWLKWKKFQPLWKIRNYFGEQIALYFAWLGNTRILYTVYKNLFVMETVCTYEKKEWVATVGSTFPRLVMIAGKSSKALWQTFLI